MRSRSLLPSQSADETPTKPPTRIPAPSIRARAKARRRKPIVSACSPSCVAMGRRLDDATAQRSPSRVARSSVATTAPRGGAGAGVASKALAPRLSWRAGLTAFGALPPTGGCTDGPPALWSRHAVPGFHFRRVAHPRRRRRRVAFLAAPAPAGARADDRRGQRRAARGRLSAAPSRLQRRAGIEKKKKKKKKKRWSRWGG